MGIFKNFDRNKWLYNGLIFTFIVLYGVTAFVSFYHAITFFNIANAIWLSILLSFVAEIGQASVLFSILLSEENKSKFLSWAIMIILTSLQVIGNVVSSFDWIVAHNDAGLDGFKRSILFAVQAEDDEMFRVIVAWISGALLPVIALSMTGLVAQNINIVEEKKKLKQHVEVTGNTPSQESVINATDIISEVSRVRPTEEDLENLSKLLDKKVPIEKPPIEVEIYKNDILGRTEEEITKNEDLLKEEVKRIKDIMEKAEKISSPKIEADDGLSEMNKVIEEESDFLSKATQLDRLNTLMNKVVVPSLSDEEIHEMNLDDYEKEHINEPDDPDEFVPFELTDEIPDQILPEIAIKQNNGLIETVQIEEEKTLDETPPLIELEKTPNETPEIITPPIERLTPEQLERIRQIARDRMLKKK
jgi:hypothetical protein